MGSALASIRVAVVIGVASWAEAVANFRECSFDEFGNPVPSVHLPVFNAAAMTAHGDSGPVIGKSAVGFRGWREGILYQYISNEESRSGKRYRHSQLPDDPSG